MPHHLIQNFESAHEGYLRDESRRAGKADSISFPARESDVKDVLAAIRERGGSITIQGARTGLVAGAVPEGGHVLNLERMNRIAGLRRDERSGGFFLTVQPGVLLANVQEALATRRFDTEGWTADSLAALELLKSAPPQFFPPDPTETTASLGGMAACNASGARSFHYGPTAAHVEALRIVLADGSSVSLRRGAQKARGRHFRFEAESGRILEGELPDLAAPNVKNAAGYRVFPNMDILDLFIGMEGTLAVVTEIELRLSRAPKILWGLMAFPPDEQSALRLVRLLRGETIPGVPIPAARPLAIEFFNHDALDLLRKQKGANPAFSEIPDIPLAYHAGVYVEYGGESEDAVSDAAMEASEAMTALGGDEDAVWLATDDREMERLKNLRHAVPEAVNLTIDERRRAEPSLTKLGTDMAVPDARLEEVMAMYNAGLARAGLESVMFGHIGNNHVHVNILPRTPDDYARGKALYLEWAREVVRMGGSVSAEHGIGKIKRAFLEMMAGADGIEKMRRLKRLFDPGGMLNPGNLFSAQR